MKNTLIAFTAAILVALRASAADYTLQVNYNSDVGAIAPEVMGFNAVYSNEPDAQWQNGTGNLPTLLGNINTKMIRFPAGTVVTFWHWNDPNVPGHTDSWDPNYNHANDKPASACMSIDEYLAVCAAKGLTPLVGVNMGSGKRWNRVTDGINEAKALVQHCMASGVNVVYYYLDNEPYAADANYTWTAAEYATSINQYVPALKSVNPNIKIIANLHPGENTTGYNYTQTVLNNAGANIDFMDIHCYWRYNAATFANWTSEAEMMHQQTHPFSQLRSFYRGMAATAGFPNIEFCSLEWNNGPFGTGNTEPTEAQDALMSCEQFMQFVGSGVKLLTCWPLHWESGDPHRAVISSAQGYTPNKKYDMFAQFAALAWRMQVSNTLGGTAAQDRLRHLSVKTNDGTSVSIFLVNKNQATANSVVDLDLSSFTNFNAQSAVAFEASDTTAGPLNVHSLAVTKSGTHLTITMPKNSFAKVSVTRPAQQVTLPAIAATKDAMVKFAAATTNFGTATNMQVSGQTNFQKQMFLQFNVTGIPAGATVVNAKLRIESQTIGTGRSITAHSVSNTTWIESGTNSITWNNKPALGTARSTVSTHNQNAYTEWDVTAGVTANGNVTFGLDGTYSGDTNFFAREAGSGTAPQLVITYQP